MLLTEKPTLQRSLTEAPSPSSLANLGLLEKPYMCQEHLLYFRQKLISWKRALLEGGDAAILSLQRASEVVPDPNDLASQEEDFSMTLRRRERERHMLQNIDISLRLIEEKEYGYCEVCGVDIGLERLEIRPTAVMCIDCKTIDEMRHKKQ